MSLVPAVSRALYPYFQRCLIAFGLFAIVMFIGVLPENSRARRYLLPIRGELSIIAAIFTVGHVVNYLSSYLVQFSSGFSGMASTMAVSFLTSALLIVLLVLLTVTSFNAIRNRMNFKIWKRIQLLAYPFFALVYVHLLLILGPSASGIEQKAFSSVLVYTVIIGCYAILRLAKAYSLRRERASSKGMQPS